MSHLKYYKLHEQLVPSIYLPGGHPPGIHISHDGKIVSNPSLQSTVYIYKPKLGTETKNFVPLNDKAPSPKYVVKLDDFSISCPEKSNTFDVVHVFLADMS